MEPGTRRRHRQNQRVVGPLGREYRRILRQERQEAENSERGSLRFQILVDRVAWGVGALATVGGIVLAVERPVEGAIIAGAGLTVGMVGLLREVTRSVEKDRNKIRRRQLTFRSDSVDRPNVASGPSGDQGASAFDYIQSQPSSED